MGVADHAMRANGGASSARTCVGAGTTIGPHCGLRPYTRIGSDNCIFQFASIGRRAVQDKKYAGEPTWLEIADGNTIREFVTINTGTVVTRASRGWATTTGSWPTHIGNTLLQQS